MPPCGCTAQRLHVTMPPCRCMAHCFGFLGAWPLMMMLEGRGGAPRTIAEHIRSG